MANKKSQKTSGTRKKKKPSIRQSKYAAERKKGKSMRQAALDAGYAPSVAEKAGPLIEESVAFRQNFRNAIRQRITAERLAKVIDEGLDAINTETFSHVVGSKLKGTDHIELTHVDKIAWTERREYAKLAAKMGDFYNEKLAFEGADGVEVRVSFVGE